MKMSASAILALSADLVVIFVIDADPIKDIAPFVLLGTPRIPNGTQNQAVIKTYMTMFKVQSQKLMN